jgi:catalase
MMSKAAEKGRRMPLPSDERVIRLANDLIAQFDAMYGQHLGFRPDHAKGVLLTGQFMPSPQAAALTRAPHVMRESTPVTARFSNFTGFPLLPDSDPNANPRGLAIRFQLAEHVHTDIISHSTDGFPSRTGQELLEFQRAGTATRPSAPPPSPLEEFLRTHPAALAFVQTPKPSPASFAKEAYFGVNAFRFSNRDGIVRYGRYRITPSAGVEHLDDAAAKVKDANYVFDELRERLAREAVQFEIHVQVAEEGDIVDDATIHWPESRRLVTFGRIALTASVPDSDAQQQVIIFDPIPRVDGIEASADPLLELRAAVYLLSGRRRRQAPPARPS